MTGRPLPDDPALGDLELLFPRLGAPAFVADAVSAGAGVELDAESATVGYVRWRPGRGCTVLWSFPRAGQPPLLVSGRLRSRERARLALEVFPVDGELPGLPFAADAPRVGAALGAELAEAVVVAYKPNRRCVLRYTDATGRPRFFGKVFRDDRGAPMAGWFGSLGAGFVGRDAVWELPVPAAYLPEPRLLLFEGVEGAVELAQLIRAADGAARAKAITAIGRAAEGLAAFRQIAVEGVPVITPQDILRPLERGRRELEPVLPETSRAVGARLGELAQLAAELAPDAPGLSHGAFRAGQLLMRGERIVVLDLDSLCLAGAATDPGCFLAGLDLTGVRSPRLRPVLAACEATFVEALERAARVDARWLAWHRAAACVEHALRRAYALDADWPERSALLLERAAEVLPTPTTA